MFLINNRSRFFVNVSTVISFAGLVASTQPVFANSYVNAYLLKSDNSAQFGSDHTVTPGMNKWDSWVEESEVRLSTNDLSGLDDQNYAFRVKFKNHQQQQAEREILSLQAQKTKLQFSDYRLSALQKSYADIIGILEQKQKIDGLREQQKLARLESSTYKKLVTTKQFNPAKIQRAEVEANRFNAQIRSENLLLNARLKTIGIPVANKRAVQQFFNHRQWLVGISEIIRLVDQQKFDQMRVNNPTLQRLNLASRIARKQSHRAKAGLKTALNLFELEYDQDKDAFGATIGIRIPLGKSSFNTLSRDTSYQQAQLAQDMTLVSIKNNLLESKLSLHRYYDAYKLQQQLQHSLNTRLKRVIKTGRPELILSLKKGQLKHRTSQQNIFLKMLREYLRFLSVSGQIAEKPLRNWLHKGQPRIQRSPGR